MNTLAYDRNLPCLNPNCHSHGRPHPNCRCYGFAKGGEVKHYCSEARAHNPSCEYYMSEGGETAPEWDSLSAAPPDADKQNTPSWESLSATPPQENKAPNWNDLSSEPPKEQPINRIEQTKAAIEGGAQGLIGPFAPMLETGLGISTKEAINKRAQDFPITHGVAEGATLLGGLAFGVGEAGLIAKGAGAISKVAEAAEIGKVGSAALRGLVQGASFATCDEMTKALLGQGDPEHPVSAALLHVGAAGLMGSLAGGAFGFGEGLIGKGLESEAGAKMASKAQDYLFELGQSASPMSHIGISAAAASIPAYKTSKAIEDSTGIPMWATFAPIEAVYTAVGEKVISKVNPYISSAAVKALMENEPSAMPNVFHYVSKIANGVRDAAHGVSTIMNIGSAKIAPETSEKAKEFLKTFIAGGQVGTQIKNSTEAEQQKQTFANGGMVSSPSNGFAKVFPEQNTILNTAKGRISNYLNGIRPLSNQPKLAFDKPASQIEKTRSYDNAINIAVNPLSILDHINRGTITPEHMQHFTSMYPEVHNYLSREMTKKIIDVQLKNGKPPPYHKRQGMSLFLGAPLDSTFTQAAIAGIQSIYAAKGAQNQGGTPTKSTKGTAPLSKAPNSYLTGGQAREQRQQNQKA